MKKVMLLLGLVVMLAFTIGIGCSGKPKFSEEQYISSAMEAQKAGNLEDAAFNYESLIKYFPESEKIGEYRTRLIDTYLALADKAGANKGTAYLKQAQQLADASGNDTLKYWIAYTLYTKTLPVDSAAAEKIVQPINADGWFIIAQKLLSQHNTKATISVYEGILSRFPNYKRADKVCFLIGFCYSEYLKDYDSAKVWFQKVADEYPKSDLADDAQWMIENMGKPPDQIVFKGDSTKPESEGKKQPKATSNKKTTGKNKKVK